MTRALGLLCSVAPNFTCSLVKDSEMLVKHLSAYVRAHTHSYTHPNSLQNELPSELSVYSFSTLISLEHPTLSSSAGSASVPPPNPLPNPDLAVHPPSLLPLAHEGCKLAPPPRRPAKGGFGLRPCRLGCALPSFPPHPHTAPLNSRAEL